MSENTEKEIDIAFVVVTHTDGTFSVQLEYPEEKPVALRQATSYDVYQTAQQITKEIENQILTERIVGTLLQVLAPPAPAEQTVPEAVKDKLKERGINPDEK